MSLSHSRPPRGFTLVEMLVVIAIIGVLAALLLPAVMYALVRAKNAAVAIDLNQLTSAIESYKQDKGDYPPNFRDRSIVERHIRKCYPKADQTYVSATLDHAFGAVPGSNNLICESECLVFWLMMTDNDPRYPFLSYFVGTTGRTPNPKKYIDLDSARLKNPDGDATPSYEAKNCQETFFVYIDSRSYERPTRDVVRFQGESTFGSLPVPAAAIAEDNAYVRPYWSLNKGTGTTTSNYLRDQNKPINPTTFQLICAGLDGEFGHDLNNDIDVKLFPDGTNYVEEDKDNIANFSGGKRLGDSIE